MPDSVTEIGAKAFLGAKSVSLPPEVNGMETKSIYNLRSTETDSATLVGIRDRSGAYQFSYYIPRELPAYRIDEIKRFGDLSMLDDLYASGAVKGFEDKVKVALSRLCCADDHIKPSERMILGGYYVKPSEGMAAQYSAYIKRNAKKASKLFEGKHDVVAQSMMSFLGYDLEELRIQRAKDARKPKKPKKASMSEMIGEAEKAMAAGDDTKLLALEPYADKIRPVAAVKLLMYAAARGTEKTIDELYRMFKSFEMPSRALCYAITWGNEETARALIKRGATLEPVFEPVPVKDDSPAKQDRRRKQYGDECEFLPLLDREERRSVWSSNLYTWHCEDAMTNAQSEDLVVKLATEGLLSDRDMKSLVVMALLVGSRESAKKLYDIVGKSTVRIRIGYWRCNHVQSVVDYEDILYAGCDPGLVEDVCSVMPERIDAMWKPSYVKYPEAAAVMLPHLNASKFPNTKALLNAFAKGGFTEAIREMHALGFELTDKSLAKAVQIAAEAGNTETTATLLSLMSESDSQTAAPDLTL